jgi:hypothetical protein
MSQKIFLIIAFILPLFFSGEVTHAQIAYTVSPLVIDIEAKSRDILSRSIILLNTGTVPITVYPTVNNISEEEGGTIDDFVPQVMSDRTTSLASWIEVSRRGIDLFPGEPYTLPVTFRMSPDPLPGTYHAFIGFGYGRNQDEAIRQVENGQAPGAVVNLTVADTKVSLLKLSGFVVDRFITRAENQAAVYTYKNPGDETVMPHGEIIIYDATGKEVGAVSVNEQNLAIPPGGEETFRLQVPTQGLFGKYKAFLSVEYGNTQKGSIQDTHFFYAIPLMHLLIAFSILGVLVIFFAWHFHRKYLTTEEDDSAARITLRIRDTESESKEHDVNLKKS